MHKLHQLGQGGQGYAPPQLLAVPQKGSFAENYNQHEFAKYIDEQEEIARHLQEMNYLEKNHLLPWHLIRTIDSV